MSDGQWLICRILEVKPPRAGNQLLEQLGG